MHQRSVEPPEVDLVANHEYEEEAAAAAADDPSSLERVWGNCEFVAFVEMIINK